METKVENLEVEENSIASVYVFDIDDFECGDEVLVESSPPASPVMAARLAAPAQGSTGGAGGGGSPTTVRELIVIPELPNSIHLQHAIQQVSSTVVEVNGDSSGHSSPTTEAQHTYITVAMQGAWRAGSLHIKEEASDQESEGGNGVNYHVQYVEPQEIYTQGHQQQMETLRTYPVYGVTTVGGASTDAAPDSAWPAGAAAEYTAYGVVVNLNNVNLNQVAGDEVEEPASPAAPAGGPQVRMPPATVQWLLDHYETAEGVSLPRSTLYSHYLRHCSAHRLDPVNAASFGKLIRSVFVGLRTRRLGTRGNSKYHYYGIRAKAAAGEASPPLDTSDEKSDLGELQEGRDREREREQASSPAGLAGIAHRQYLGPAGPPDPPPLELRDQPPDIPAAALDTLREIHKSHGVEFLEAVSALDTGAVERTRRAFWRRVCGAAGGGARRAVARREGAAWLRAADLRLHQQCVDLLLPDVLRPIPPQLTQAIRNFSKSLESALAAGATEAPAAAARAQAAAAAALAAALRRYTSLNHLAQAARAVLANHHQIQQSTQAAAALRRYTSLNHLAQAARAVLANHHQIQQMLSDLNRVDFRVVREQAAWACSCGSAATAHRLEADFKATLGRGATLEQWAAWLEGCVRSALAAHERRPDYTARARRLLLDWSFYSSLVIRELTLRSAASFGSFHLIRLLYDEYVSYLIERRVAAHHRAPPISVMTRPKDDEEESGGEAGGEPDDDDPDWEWDDDDDDDDDQPHDKKAKLD